MRGKEIGKVDGLGVRVQDPHERKISRAEDLAHLPDDVVRLRGGGADPRCAVRPGDRVVGLEGDPVARGLDDLDAGGRRLAKAVGKLHQPLLQYFGHGAILAGDAALAPAADHGRAAWTRLARHPGSLRLRLRELKARAFDARRGRRPRGNCGSLLSVCLARPGSLTANRQIAAPFITTECPWTPSTRLVSTCPPECCFSGGSESR